MLNPNPENKRSAYRIMRIKSIYYNDKTHNKISWNAQCSGVDRQAKVTSTLNKRSTLRSTSLGHALIHYRSSSNIAILGTVSYGPRFRNEGMHCNLSVQVKEIEQLIKSNVLRRSGNPPWSEWPNVRAADGPRRRLLQKRWIIRARRWLKDFKRICSQLCYYVSKAQWQW